MIRARVQQGPPLGEARWAPAGFPSGIAKQSRSEDSGPLPALGGQEQTTANGRRKKKEKTPRGRIQGLRAVTTLP